MKVWIVCRPCDDPYYEGHPTGLVFTDKEKAEAYLRDRNGEPDGTEAYFNSALYLEKGELQ